MKKTNNLYFCFSLAIISVSPYAATFINYPFNVELKETFFFNLIIGLIFYSTIYFFFINFFYSKRNNNFFFKIINFLFYFVIFLFSLKTFILNLGFLNIPDFTRSVFNYDILSFNRKIIFTLIIFLIFLLIIILNKKLNINYEKFIYSFALAITILFIFYLPYNYDRLIKTEDTNLKGFNSVNNKISADKKVILLIFDEWDSKKYFNNDAIDKTILDKISTINFKNAVPTGRDTIYSITAFLLGKDGTGDISFNRKKLNYRDKDKLTEIKKENTFFSLAGKEQAAIVGSGGFPYCTYIKIKYCIDKSNELDKAKLKDLTSGLTTLKSFYNFFVHTYLFDNEALKSDKKTKIIIEKKIKQERNIFINERYLNIGFEAIKDKSLSLVYLHLPFPHHPSFYAKSFFDKKNNFYNTDNEIINFNLTSYVIEKLFNIVNSKEMNQEILTIVTSDHGLRKPNTITLVPMIISLSNQNEKITINKEISAFHVNNLLKEFYADKIKNHSDIVDFFDKKVVTYPKLNTYDEKNKTIFTAK